MENFYLVILAFLALLACFDLFVGVSNDASNFLNSALGCRISSYRTTMIVASVGVLLGATFSSGMMEIARSGVFHPQMFSFAEIMVIFFAVMVSDVLLLDTFNSLGLPTSTTVSIVFELLGSAMAAAMYKLWVAEASLAEVVDFINTSKALTIITGILVSVVVAFIAGSVVQYLVRLVFTFHFERMYRRLGGIFGGISITAIFYFLIMKGAAGASFMRPEWLAWINGNTDTILLTMLIGFSAVFQLCILAFNLNVFRIIILSGTFSLAFAFAGNDLVNFVGVPLAALDSVMDFMAHGSEPGVYMMSSLLDDPGTPTFFLLFSGLIMVMTLWFSKKARQVVQTSINLSSSQSGTHEQFGSSLPGRMIVRSSLTMGNLVRQILPAPMQIALHSRFKPRKLERGEAPLPFDYVRASVNLVLSSILIASATSLKLPLSTTYVTFMVAMGTSLADRAWSRQSAVFRITGVLSVIGGWFITAGVAFIVCYLVTCIMFFGHFPAMAIGIVVAIVFLVRSNIKQAKKSAQDNQDNLFVQIMRSRDENNNWTLLTKHVRLYSRMQLAFVADCYRQVTDAFFREEYRPLKKASSRIEEQRNQLKRQRRKEVLALRRVNHMLSIERNTWYFLSIGALNQMLYCLKRITEPCREHIGNNFLPVNSEYITPFMAFRKEILRLFDRAYILLDDSRVDEAGMNDSPEELRADATALQRQLSGYRKTIIDDIQNRPVNLESMILFLSLVQESQELLSNLRHMIRGYAKFSE